jgi:hypothetical protein
MHQAMASIPLSPMGVPSRRPRTVSMIGVKGWCSANQLRPSGIESVGTKPLDRNGRITRNIGRLLAVSTSLGTMPRATESQETASAACAARSRSAASPNESRM